MKIVIQAKNLELTQEIKDFIEEKINDLERFSDDFQDEKYFNGFFGKGKPRVEAWVEVGKETLHHRKGNLFYAECQMRFPKKSLRSVAKRDDLKLAITEVKDELQRQLKQYKRKLAAKTERKARVIKEEIKLSPAAKISKKGKMGKEEIKEDEI